MWKCKNPWKKPPRTCPARMLEILTVECHVSTRKMIKQMMRLILIMYISIYLFDPKKRLPFQWRMWLHLSPRGQMMAFFGILELFISEKRCGKKKSPDKNSGKSILNISPHSSPFPTIHTNNPIHGRVWISSITQKGITDLTHPLLFQLSEKNCATLMQIHQNFECVYSELTPKLAQTRLQKNGSKKQPQPGSPWLFWCRSLRWLCLQIT